MPHDAVTLAMELRGAEWWPAGVITDADLAYYSSEKIASLLRCGLIERIAWEAAEMLGEHELVVVKWYGQWAVIDDNDDRRDPRTPWQGIVHDDRLTCTLLAAKAMEDSHE